MFPPEDLTVSDSASRHRANGGAGDNGAGDNGADGDELFPDFGQELAKARRELDRLEADIAQAQATFESALESNANGVIICDASGEVQFRNAVADDLFGEEATYRAFHPNGTLVEDELWAVKTCLAEQRSVAPYEMVVEREDGSRRVVLCSASPIIDADGRLVGAIGLFSNVTRLKRVERAERRARKTAERAAEGLAALQRATSELLDTFSPEEAVYVAAERADHAG